MKSVLDPLEEYPNIRIAGETVAGRPGFGAEPLPREVRQAQVDAGDRGDQPTRESERVRRLERQNREFRRANAFLHDAAVVFAGENDSRRR